MGLAPTKSVHEYHEELEAAAPWSVFNKWCKIVRAMTCGPDAVTPEEAGRRIKAMRYRPPVTDAERAEIDEAVTRIGQEQKRSVANWIYGEKVRRRTQGASCDR